MKKILLLSITLLLLSYLATAQVASYSFAASSGTYTSLAGATNVFPSGWDDNAAISVPISFTFKFNNTDYTTVYIHPNGYITFGSSTSGYVPISGGSAVSGVISAWGRDLQAQNTAPLGSVDYLSSGGVFTVQWIDTRRYNSTTTNAERFEMQIQLYQTTNVIKIVYGNWSNAASATTSNNGEVGLRGTSGTDFKNLEVLSGGSWASPSAGAVNTATCYYNETTVATKPAPGQTYTFTPPVAGTPLQPTNPSPANAATGVPVNGSLTWTFGTNTVTYDLKFGPTGSMVQVVTGAAAGASGSYAYSSLTPSAGYQWQVIEHNGALLTNGPVWSFTTACNPISSFPWNEGFEGLVTVGANILPLCWSYTNITSNNYSCNGTCNSNTAHTGTNFIGGSWSFDIWNFTPGFQLNAGTTYAFTYWFKCTDATVGYNVGLAYGTSPAAASMTNVLNNETGLNIAAWTQRSFSFSPGSSGTYYFGLHNVCPTSSPNGIAFDDFSVSVLLPCITPPAQPTVLVLTPTTTSITGSFTAAASTDKYLVVRSLSSSLSANPVNGTTYTVGNTLGGGIVDYYGPLTSFTSTGLTPATLYYYFVFSANDVSCSGAPYYLATSPLTGNKTTLPLVPLNGTKTVGPTGDFFTLTAAFAYLNFNGVNGPLNLVLQSTYVSSAEPAFPIPALFIPGASAINKVTVYPSVTGLSITSSSATGTLNMNGAGYIVFDGRVNATGSTKDLVIENTNVSGYAIQHINDARYNTFQYCQIKGVETSATMGIIQYSTTTGTFGNSNNLLDNCDIRDGATTPANLIYSSGTSGFPNINNTVSNCNLFNWFLASTTSQTGAINLLTGSSDWIISGNSFYQTATRTYTSSGIVSVIVINNTVNGYNFNITNNFIGGILPSCGGTAMTFSATTGTPIYRLIYITFANGTPSTIQGNTISNIAMSTASASTALSIISHLNGHLNVINNTIGSQSLTGSITMTNTGASTAAFFLMFSLGTGATFSNINVSGNTIGGISLSASTTGANSFRLIYAQPVVGSSLTINNNTIGGTVANSIVQNTNQIMSAIMVLNPTVGNIITNNTIRNLTHANTGVTGSITGINLQSSGGHTVTGNNIYNLTTNSTNTLINNGASIVGLTMTAGVTPGTVVSQNTIYNLVNTNTTVAGCINGMYFATPNIGQTTISRNLIHSFSTASATSYQIGIFFPNTGIAMIYDNMVRLGIDAAGVSLTNSIQIYGIYKASSGNAGIYFNSVYIGGTGVVSGTVNTYAFFRGTSGGTDTLVNNIFVNNRSNASGTGKHYGIGTNANTNLVCNFNLYQGTGTGGVFGVNNAVDYTTIALWRGGTNLDLASGYGDPNFILPGGTSITLDLHVQSNTAIEAAGTPVAGVTLDYDGTARSGLTPVDIGADAGNFTSSGDIFPPNIIYTPLTNGTTANRVLTNFATITDNIAVSGGASLPRIYYKKSGNANTFGGNTSADDGWKYTIASNSSSPYSFTIDYSKILGGSVANGDIIQYFIVAQDAANNLSSNWGGAGASGPPPVQNMNAAPPIANVLSYTIAGSVSGTLTVGTTGTYPSLTGAGGAFAAINAGTVTGNLTIQVKSDLTEDGTNALNPMNEDPPGSNFTLTIQPFDATERLISGTVANGMIRLFGADRIIFDGRFSGSGRYLRFRNLNTANPTFTFINDATGNTIRNCFIEGANTGTTSGVILFSTTTAAIGNDNNTITSNIIRDLSSAAGVPYNLVYASGTAGKENSNLTFSDNEFFNFSNYGVNISATGSGDGMVFTNNSIYQTAPRASTLYGIYIGAGNSHNLTGNSFGGSNASRTGAALQTTGATGQIYGIYLALANSTPTSVQGNIMSNFGSTGTGSTTNVWGLYIATGNVNVGTIAGNTFGGGALPSDTIRNGYDNGVIFTASAWTVNIENNLIGNMGYYNAGGDRTAGIYVGAGTVSVKNNIIRDIKSNSTSTGTSFLPVGIMLASTLPCNVEGNTIYNIINSNPGTATAYTAAGIVSTGNWFNSTIHKNKIYNIKAVGTGTSTNSPQVYGIYLSSGNASYYNNLISIDGGTNGETRIYGIQDASSGTNNYYFNSINVFGTATGSNASYGFLKSGSSVVKLNNNILNNARTGGTTKPYAIGASNTTGFTSNNNDFYTAGTPLGLWGAADQANLAAWKLAVTPQDANSVSVNPMFVSTTDLHTCTPELNGAGITVSGITTDYAGVTRGNPPDIGAYEFSVPLPTITGPATVCEGTAGNIYSTEPGMSGYTWVISAGGIITAGPGTNQVTVTWNTPGPQTLSVNYANVNGCFASIPTVKNVTVNPNATIALTSAPGTNAQSLCVNTPITNIIYAIGGGGTGGGVTGLPTGVTGSYAAGVFTITGTPSITGTFNYTVTTTGTCTQTNATGVITVNPDATISLTSAPGTNAQSLCVNTPITNITYSIGGGGTGAGITGLPTGVTGSYAAGVFTISGSPSITGTFNYTITTTGTCVQTSAIGSITVNPDATISLSSPPGTNSQSLCINTPITNITYSIGGGGTGAGVTGLPTGITGSYAAGVFTISGTPSVSGVFSYTVTTTGTCVQTTAIGTISVNPNATITLTSGPATNAQSLCVNTPITNITYTIGGGGTGAGVTGLPTGVTGAFAAGVFTISGSPSVTGIFNYTVTTTGTCVQTTAVGTMTVNPDATIILTSAAATNAQSLCINTPITNITYSIGGGGTGAGVTGLPTGVTGSYAAGVFTITGTPSVTGIFNYSVTTTGTCLQVSAIGTITVNPDATITLTSAPGTNAQSLCVNIPITNITYAVGGGGAGAGVTGLPTGVTGAYAAGVFTISGSPSVTGIFNYTVTTTGSCVQTTATGTITVNPDATIALTSAPGTDSQSLCVNTPITNITYTIGGGGTGAGITGLPTGVTGAFAAGVFTIGGTPSVSGVFSYTVTTTGTCVQKTATGTITVNPDATIVLTSAAGTNAQSVCVNTPITNITYSISGGGTGAGVTGLPTGVTGAFAVGVFTISGSSSVIGIYNYTVTTTGTCIQTTATGTITVDPVSVGGSIAGSATVCAGTNSTLLTLSGYAGNIVKWQYSTDNWATSTDIANTLNTYTATNLMVTTKFRAVIQSGACTPVNSSDVTVTVNPQPVPVITGPANVIVGTSGHIYTTDLGMTGYLWAISGGGVIDVGQGSSSISVTWNTSGLQWVSVTYTDANSCNPATPTVYNVNVLGIPGPAGPITGVTPVCQGQMGVPYSVAPILNATGYVWSLPTGASVATGNNTNSITVDFSATASSGNITVYGTNAFGSGAVSPPFAVTVNPAPVASLTGPATACFGTIKTYNTDAGNSNYTWIVTGGTKTAGGTVNDNFVTVNWNVGAPIYTGSVSVTYTSALGCPGLVPTVMNVTVNPLPVPTITGPTPVCVNSVGNFYATEQGKNNYVWSVSGGGMITGGGTLADYFVVVSWTGSGSQSVSVNYMNGFNCFAINSTIFPVTVIPNVGIPVFGLGSSSSRCQGAGTVTYNAIATNNTGLTYALDATSLAAGNTINSGTGAVTYVAGWVGTSIITATATGCGPSTQATHAATTNPTPVVSPVSNAAYCNGATAGPIIFTGTPGGVTFAWINSNTTIGLPASGTGAIPAFTALNTGTAPVVATITVTPTANGCVGSPVSFTITVNPTPTVNPVSNATYCNGAAAAAISFSSPASGGTITYNWTSTANVGFGTSGTGNIPAYTATNATNAPVIATVSVTATMFGCTGPVTTFTVTVNPTPLVNSIANATYCNGAAAAAISFTTPASGGTVTYNWTSTANIGFGTSGSGNIPAYTATNATNVPVIATVSVTATMNGCTGPATTFTVTVNPTPVVNSLANLTYCTGVAAAAINFTTPTSGGTITFNWTSTANVGFGTSGTGNIPAYTATNATSAPVVAIVSVTATMFGCTGPVMTFTVTVNPTPTGNAVSNVAYCNGANTAVIPLTGPVAGTTFAWTNSAPSIGLAASGTGNIPSFVATNIGSTPVVATITVTPSVNGCTGPTFSFTITVNPTTTVNPIGNVSYCNGATTTAINFGSPVTGTTYAWTNSNPSIGLAASGTGNIPSFTATNAGTVPAIATIIVTPSANGCTGTNFSFTITVYPTTTVNPVANAVYCNLATTSPIIFSSPVAGTTYAWTNSTPSIGLAASGTGNIPSFTATNGTALPVVATITVTPSANGCTGTIRTFTITVNPTPTLTSTLTPPAICNNTVFSYTPTSGTPGTTFAWTRAAVAGISNSPAAGTGNPLETLNNTTALPVSVTYVYTLTANGCTNPATYNVVVVVNPTPVLTSTLTPPPICSGSLFSYTPTSTTPGTTFAWTRAVVAGISNPAGSGTGNPNEVLTNTTPNPVNVTYVYTLSANGCTNPSTYSVVVTVNPNPTLSSTLTPPPICSNTLFSYNPTSATAGTTFAWTRAAVTGITNPPASGTGNPNEILVNSTTNPINVTYVYTLTANGCTNPVTYNVVVTVNPLPVPTITGYTSMCANVGLVDYVTEAGMSNYIWTVSAGNAIYSGQGTNHVQITWNLPGAQWVAVTYSNAQGCGATAPTTLNVFISPLPDPAGTISGTAAVCGGATGVIYSVGAIANASSYIWTLPAGATIASGAGSNSITVDFDASASSGNITVYGNNSCGNGAVSPPFAVTVTQLPGIAGVIAGDTAVCQGVSGLIYSVAPIANASGYVWTVPAGATIVAGANTNSITVDFAFNAVSGMITVYGTNSCGNGLVGPEFHVSVYPVPPTPIVTVINDIILHSNVPTGNQWYYLGTPIPGATGQEYTADQSGEYWCVVTWNGCSSDTSNHVWIVMPGIQPGPSSAKFVVYPVPNDGQFKVTITYPVLETFNIKVYNNLGVMIHEIRNVAVNGTTERSIDLRPTPSGVYSVVIENGNNHVIRKIMITR